MRHYYVIILPEHTFDQTLAVIGDIVRRLKDLDGLRGNKYKVQQVGSLTFSGSMAERHGYRDTAAVVVSTNQPLGSDIARELTDETVTRDTDIKVALELVKYDPTPYLRVVQAFLNKIKKKKFVSEKSPEVLARQGRLRDWACTPLPLEDRFQTFVEVRGHLEVLFELGLVHKGSVNQLTRLIHADFDEAEGLDEVEVAKISDFLQRLKSPEDAPVHTPELLAELENAYYRVIQFQKEHRIALNDCECLLGNLRQAIIKVQPAADACELRRIYDFFEMLQDKHEYTRANLTKLLNFEQRVVYLYQNTRVDEKEASRLIGGIKAWIAEIENHLETASDLASDVPELPHDGPRILTNAPLIPVPLAASPAPATPATASVGEPANQPGTLDPAPLPSPGPSLGPDSIDVKIKEVNTLVAQPHAPGRGEADGAQPAVAGD
ncbi:MAG: hypothetical protein COW05_06870, partial [Gammaproteobacteria bacterium CG12_big_fil_rev_8_21_14_0_65_46_12]